MKPYIIETSIHIKVAQTHKSDVMKRGFSLFYLWLGSGELSMLVAAMAALQLPLSFSKWGGEGWVKGWRQVAEGKWGNSDEEYLAGCPISGEGWVKPWRQGLGEKVGRFRISDDEYLSGCPIYHKGCWWLTVTVDNNCRDNIVLVRISLLFKQEEA